MAAPHRRGSPEDQCSLAVFALLELKVISSVEKRGRRHELQIKMSVALIDMQIRLFFLKFCTVQQILVRVFLWSGIFLLFYRD